jgi:hypothetical protein
MPPTLDRKGVFVKETRKKMLGVLLVFPLWAYAANSTVDGKEGINSIRSGCTQELAEAAIHLDAKTTGFEHRRALERSSLFDQEARVRLGINGVASNADAVRQVQLVGAIVDGTEGAKSVHEVFDLNDGAHVFFYLVNDLLGHP